jgi:hypothetical protein
MKGQYFAVWPRFARGSRLDVAGRIGPLRHPSAGAVAPGERPHTEPDTGHTLALRRGAGQTIGLDGASVSGMLRYIA